MIKLYDSRLSGNSWKIRILLGNLGIPFERVTFVLPEGKTHQPAFLAKNPTGKVPVVELDDGQTLFESNAILTYFAEGTPLLPDDKLTKSRVMQWMFFEQADVMLNLAHPRLFIGIQKAKEANLPLIKRRWEAGYKALAVMDGHLATNAFFAGERYSIADIALYTYASMGREGEFDMDRFPNVLAWFERVRAQPGYVPLVAE